MHDPYDVGWMAGAIDGESSVVLRRTTKTRKTDGRRSVMANVLLGHTDFEFLKKYTRILHDWGIEFRYVKQRSKHRRSNGEQSPQVFVSVHKIEAVNRLIDIVVIHLSEKRARAELIWRFTMWKLCTRDQWKIPKFDTPERMALYDKEASFWDEYRRLYWGRGRTPVQPLFDTITEPNMPIRYPNC